MSKEHTKTWFFLLAFYFSLSYFIFLKLLIGNSMARRVSLTLSDEEYEVLKAYAKAANLTPTTVIHKLFTELIPVFSSVVIATQLAEQDKKASLIKLQSTLLDGIHTATGISSELQKDLSS